MAHNLFKYFHFSKFHGIDYIEIEAKTEFVPFVFSRDAQGDESRDVT